MSKGTAFVVLPLLGTAWVEVGTMRPLPQPDTSMPPEEGVVLTAFGRWYFSASPPEPFESRRARVVWCATAAPLFAFVGTVIALGAGLSSVVRRRAAEAGIDFP